MGRKHSICYRELRCHFFRSSCGRSPSDPFSPSKIPWHQVFCSLTQEYLSAAYIYIFQFLKSVVVFVFSPVGLLCWQRYIWIPILDSQIIYWMMLILLLKNLGGRGLKKDLICLSRFWLAMHCWHLVLIGLWETLHSIRHVYIYVSIYAFVFITFSGLVFTCSVQSSFISGSRYKSFR